VVRTYCNSESCRTKCLTDFELASPAVTPVCVVDIVLQSTGAANPVSWIGCDSSLRPPLTFYHNNPAAGATTPAASTPATSTPATGNSLQSGSAPVTQGTGPSISGGGPSGSVASIPVSTQTISGSVTVIYSVTTVPAAHESASASTSGTSHPTSSKAWIAGAVAGPIVVLLIVAALVIYMRSKRKGKGAQPASTAAQPGGYYQQPKDGYYEVSATPAPTTTSGLAELAGSHPATYNYSTGSVGQTYMDYSVPQAAPVEMDATRR